jgi:RNA polymerase sigma factor (sigma-70 family)
VTPPRRHSKLEEVFREHRGRLYSYLRRRLTNEDDAQELAQEAFLRLLRVNRADLVADPQAYLYRVARNLVYEKGLRTLPAGSWAEEGELENLEDPRSTEAEAERTSLAETVESITADLSARNKAILLLFCQSGLSQREIGEKVGISKSMVQKCLAQAIAQCRKRLRATMDRNGSRNGVGR